MLSNVYFRLVIVLFFYITSPVAVYADQGKGLAIAREMKAREKGFDNYSVAMKMVLISISGKEKIRQL